MKTAASIFSPLLVDAEWERNVKADQEKKKLIENPITHSQLEWELATHAEGYSAEILQRGKNKWINKEKKTQANVKSKIKTARSVEKMRLFSEWIVYMQLSLPN